MWICAIWPPCLVGGSSPGKCHGGTASRDWTVLHHKVTFHPLLPVSVSVPPTLQCCHLLISLRRYSACYWACALHNIFMHSSYKAALQSCNRTWCTCERVECGWCKSLSICVQHYWKISLKLTYVELATNWERFLTKACSKAALLPDREAFKNRLWYGGGGDAAGGVVAMAVFL